MKPALLTKSRLMLATECPRKLAYNCDPKYANTKADDEFLEALAQSGHQVGELARSMHPDGIEITSRELEEQVAETNLHLQKPSVTLFEPTFRVGNLLVRVDVLIKHGNDVQLIEVKSKSHDRTNPEKRPPPAIAGGCSLSARCRGWQRDERISARRRRRATWLERAPGPAGHRIPL
ncbi:MAG: uncharacterized protein JWN85_1162 [Gammaproteobacteria bacterium]|jgi:hypothetical protein|nr:uncharacterized protein [Gammaproteobacteria bacterium]